MYTYIHTYIHTYIYLYIYIYTVPREGGRYLVVQGRVQEVEKDLETGTYKTKMVSCIIEKTLLFSISALCRRGIWGNERNGLPS